MGNVLTGVTGGGGELEDIDKVGFTGACVI